MWNRDMPHFESWSHLVLARFAKDAYLRMQEDAAELERRNLEIKRLEQLIKDLERRLADDWK